MTEPGKEIEPSLRNQSMVMVQIGKKQYPMVREKRCSVCMHPARVLIEEQIILDTPYPAIVNDFSEKEVINSMGERVVYPHLSIVSVKNHYRLHSPMNAQMVRSFSEEIAKERGIEFEPTVKQFANHSLVVEATITQFWEKLMRGEAAVDAKDALAAIKLKMEMEKAAGAAGTVDVEVWSNAMRIFWAEVQKIMSPEQLTALNTALRNNEELRNLMNGQQSDDE